MNQGKQISIALLVASAIAPQLVQAQSSVTLYGRADAAIYHQKRSNPGANQWSVSSDTSYFGLRGHEDLGGGLSAIFKLESQVDLSTGSQSAAFFNREAFVGLSDKRFGNVQLGSMWGPSVWISGKADAFGRAQLGAVQTFLQGAANRGNTFQFNNTVQYITPKIGDVFGRVYVGMAEGAATGKNYAGSLDYSKGPLFLGVSFDSAQIAGGSVGASASTVRARTLGVGASYNFGPAKLFGYAQQNRISGLANATSLNASVAIPVGAGEFRAAIGKWNRPNDADAKRIAIGYTHHLSKRTQIYGVMAKLDNSSRSTTMLFPISQDSSAAAPGQDVRSFGVGMRHMF